MPGNVLLRPGKAVLLNDCCIPGNDCKLPRPVVAPPNNGCCCCKPGNVFRPLKPCCCNPGNILLLPKPLNDDAVLLNLDAGPIYI